MGVANDFGVPNNEFSLVSKKDNALASTKEIFDVRDGGADLELKYYKNDTLGFSFKYPKIFGDIVESHTECSLYGLDPKSGNLIKSKKFPENANDPCFLYYLAFENFQESTEYGLFGGTFLAVPTSLYSQNVPPQGGDFTLLGTTIQSESDIVHYCSQEEMQDDFFNYCHLSQTKSGANFVSRQFVNPEPFASIYSDNVLTEFFIKSQTEGHDGISISDIAFKSSSKEIVEKFQYLNSEIIMEDLVESIEFLQ